MPQLNLKLLPNDNKQKNPTRLPSLIHYSTHLGLYTECTCVPHSRSSLTKTPPTSHAPFIT